MPTFVMGNSAELYADEAEKKGAFDHLIAAAGGEPLPGRWGLAQALINTWTAPTYGNRYLHMAKLGLNTVGIVRKYKQSKLPEEMKKRKDPVEDFLKENSLEEMRELDGLSNFIYVYSELLGYEDFYPGRVDDEKSTGGFVRKFVLKGGIEYYFAYKGMSRYDVGYETSTRWLDGPYVRSDQKKDFLRLINDVVWDAENNNDLQLSASKERYNRKFTLTNIGTPGDYVSSDAETEWADVEALSDRCQAFLDAGLTRKILFYGPPGCGKTTLARNLARSVSEGKTLRIESDAIEFAGTRAVMNFIMLLRPKVVLFDDLDRNRGTVVEILHYMESIGNEESLYRDLWEEGFLVVGTVNTLETIDPALLRPGRFDEVKEVREPGDKHRANIIKHYADKFGVKMRQLSKIIPGDFKKKKSRALSWANQEMTGFSPADIEEVMQCIATVGVEHFPAEVERVRLQRDLYAGDACSRFLGGKEPAAPKRIRT